MKLAQKKLFPRLFYGYFELKKKFEVKAMDFYGPQNLFYKIYHKIFTLIAPRRCLEGRVKKLNKYDLIYATTDGIAIELAKLKQQGLVSSKVVANIMSIADNEVQKQDILLLNNLDGLICFSRKIERFLIEKKIKNIRFIEFGVDTNFYKVSNQKERDVVLTIGLDSYRDWSFFINVANLLPNIEFRVIACNSNEQLFGLKNITFLGNISFINTRHEIAKAKLIFLPTKPNHYFSGQTTLFNTLAMNKYTLMPIDGNFNNYDFDEKMFYRRDEDEKCVSKRIKNILSNQKQKNIELINNHNLVLEKYNIVKFSDRLESLLTSIYEK
jgi:hypothetical protein